MARATGLDLGISTKISIEIANHLKGKTTEDAKKILNKVLRKEQPIPFKRFTDGVGHRKIISGPGRYPEKASKEFLKLIEQAEANAQVKGLASQLKIIHLNANKGSDQIRPGRQRRRMFKRTHLEIVVEEQEEPKKSRKKEATPSKEKAEEKKEEPKTEKQAVTETKKEAEKKEEGKKTEEKPVKKKETPKEEKKAEEKEKAKPATEKPSPKKQAQEKKQAEEQK